MTSQGGIANHTVPATTSDCSLYLQSSLSLSDNQIGTNHILMNDCHKQDECSYSSRLREVTLLDSVLTLVIVIVLLQISEVY